MARLRSSLARAPSALPGFGLALGFTIVYLGSSCCCRSASWCSRLRASAWAGILQIATDPRVLRAPFGSASASSFAAALIDIDLRLRHRLGADALPLPRAAADGRRRRPALRAADRGRRHRARLALRARTAGSARRWTSLGIKVAYTPLGHLGRSRLRRPALRRSARVQPLIADLEREIEEASATLGREPAADVCAASCCRRSCPAILTGFALAFARGVGEYGSVIFIAGNLPYVSEIAPLLIVIKLEEYDYAGATAIAAIMLAVSLLLPAR